MKDEQKDILKQKSSEEKKAILITIVVVLVIALLVLAAVLFLPNKSEVAENTEDLSGNPANNNESNITYDPNEGNSNELSGISADESQADISNDISDISESGELVHRWVINNLGYTYIYGDTGLEQFTSTATTIDRYAQTLNTLADSLPNNVNIYNMLAPTNVEFMSIPRAIYSADNFFNASQKNTIAAINDKLDERITGINIYDTISAHSDEYLYFRTDINWTPLAAYYAYCDFADAAGFDPVSLSEYSKQTYTGFLGRFYTATSEPTLSTNPDTIEYYLTDKNNSCKLTIYHKGVTYNSYAMVGNAVSSSANGYNVFLGMEAEYYKITTGTAGGKKLLVVSDTSAAVFVPYLVSHYSEIHYINPNFFGDSLSGLITEKGIEDVLFLSYVTNANRLAYTNVLSVLKGVTE